MELSEYPCPNCESNLEWNNDHNEWCCGNCGHRLPPVNTTINEKGQKVFYERNLGVIRPNPITSRKIIITTRYTIIYPPVGSEVSNILMAAVGSEIKKRLQIRNRSISKINIKKQVIGVIEGADVDIHYKDQNGIRKVAHVGLGTAQLEELLDMYAELNLELEIKSKELDFGKEFSDFFIKAKKSGRKKNITVHGDLIKGDKVKKTKVDKRDQRVEIKDSVINRSNIGGGSADVDDSLVNRSSIGDKDAVEDDVIQKKISICPYCGEKLNFPQTPRFCPYCEKKILM